MRARTTLPRLTVALALVACGAGASADAGQAAADRNIALSCDVPGLNFDATQLDREAMDAFTGNFREAMDRACRDGLLEGGPLVDASAEDADTIFVLDSPQANVTSIDFGPSGAPPAMLLEAPLGVPPRIPTVEELHEAIYCATRGATPEDQEESGRCLAD
jgi:hypothetical protein